MNELTYLCNECGAEFDIIHHEKTEIDFCPFCGEEFIPNFDEDIEYEEEEE